MLGEGVLSKSGGIIYSAADSLKNGDVYILGLNPGGTEGQTIAEHLSELPNKTTNSYLDESWGNRKDADGEAPLQRRIKGVVEAVGINLRDVCASNLIFMRSQTAKGVSFADADKCWPVHELILGIVQPKIIIVFGNSSFSPYAYLLNKFKSDDEQDIFDSGHGSWKCRGFTGMISGRKTYVAGFPHLSRYSPYDQSGSIKENIVAWLSANIL